MSACHGNNSSLLCDQVIASVVSRSQQLKGSAFHKFCNDAVNVVKASISNSDVFVKCFLFKQRSWSTLEELVEGEQLDEICFRSTWNCCLQSIVLRVLLLKIVDQCLNMGFIEVLSSFASGCNIVHHAQRLGKLVNFSKEFKSSVQHVVHTTPFAKVMLCIQVFVAVTKSKQVPWLNVQSHNLFKKLIESLVGVGDNQNTLVGEVVIPVGNNLHGYIGFSSSRWTHN
mmetsp:Transcript_14427/g.20113  ORF Transcript_14427/g.20113 Transcript_14427/m.20113 type:complete len:227 (-) Transcript_14427:914-1594(-)